MVDEPQSPELVAIGHGVVIEQDMLGVIQEIVDRWPELSVQYLDPDSAVGVVEAPYQIVEIGTNGEKVIALQVWELNGETIKKLEAMDSNYVNIEAVIDRSNALVKKREQQKYRDSMTDAHEKFAAVLNSSKDTYKLTDGDKKITIRSNGEHDVRRD